MNSNQRSEGNNQTDNGSNEKAVSSSRGGTVQKDNMNPEAGEYAKSGTLGVSQQQGGGQQGGAQQSDSQQGAENPGSQRQESIGHHQGSHVGQESTDRSGSQTGSQQQGQAAQRVDPGSGSHPHSPGGSHLAADQNMDDDTGFSNRVNRQTPDDIDDGGRQQQQSNVGRRSDMTPD